MKALNSIQAFVAAAALLAAGVTAGAQPAQGTGPGFGEHRPPMERMLGPEGAHGRFWNNPDVIQKLNLTDDQRKAMDQILLQHRENLIDMRATVEKSELAMEPLMQADQPDETAILAQIDKIAQARAELEKANARFLLALRAKLTPDQWKQLQAWRSERHGPGADGKRQWRGQRQHRGAPPEGGPAGPDSQPQPPPAPQSYMDEPPAPGAEGVPAPDIAPAPGAVD